MRFASALFAFVFLGLAACSPTTATGPELDDFNQLANNEDPPPECQVAEPPPECGPFGWLGSGN